LFPAHRRSPITRHGGEIGSFQDIFKDRAAIRSVQSQRLIKAPLFFRVTGGELWASKFRRLGLLFTPVGTLSQGG
jgi:hypothetical protein